MVITAKLNSCLEQIRSVLGDSTPDHMLIDAVLKQGFNHEKALDAILSQQGRFDAQLPWLLSEASLLYNYSFIIAISVSDNQFDNG